MREAEGEVTQQKAKSAIMKIKRLKRRKEKRNTNGWEQIRGIEPLGFAELEVPLLVPPTLASFGPSSFCALSVAHIWLHRLTSLIACFCSSLNSISSSELMKSSGEQLRLAPSNNKCDNT